MKGQKVKVKVKKKKINIKNISIALILIIIIILTLLYIKNMPVKNIYIIGNNMVSDKEIIKLAKLDNYPPYLNTYFSNIKSKIKKNNYIKKVKIERKFPLKIYIFIEEEKPLFIYNNDLSLTGNKQEENKYNIDYVPYVKGNIDNIYKEFSESFAKVNKEILLKISEIEYKPNEIDKERFLFIMTDKNYVYINISRMEKINKYNTIVTELSGKKGIIHLDSGDYVEIKDWQPCDF